MAFEKHQINEALWALVDEKVLKAKKIDGVWHFQETKSHHKKRKKIS